jgi:hypothetical protein
MTTSALARRPRARRPRRASRVRAYVPVPMDLLESVLTGLERLEARDR